MVYSRAGSSDLLLILGCMTSYFLSLDFSTLYSSSLWRTGSLLSRGSRCEGVINNFSGSRISLISGWGFGILKKYRAKIDSVLEVCAAGELRKTTIGTTRLNEILGRDYGIEEPYYIGDLPVYPHKITPVSNLVPRRSRRG